MKCCPIRRTEFFSTHAESISSWFVSLPQIESIFSLKNFLFSFVYPGFLTLYNVHDLCLLPQKSALSSTVRMLVGISDSFACYIGTRSIFTPFIIWLLTLSHHHHQHHNQPILHHRPACFLNFVSWLPIKPFTKTWILLHNRLLPILMSFQVLLLRLNYLLLVFLLSEYFFLQNKWRKNVFNLTFVAFIECFQNKINAIHTNEQPRHLRRVGGKGRVCFGTIVGCVLVN